MQKNFSHAFEGKIWNIESEINGAYLVIEVRNENTFETSFFVYDPRRSALSPNFLTLDESWWVGITHVAGDIIVFHTFQDAENPQEKNYEAVNIKSGKVAWKMSEVSFTEYGSTYLRGFRQNEPVVIDVLNGEPMDELDLIPTIENNGLMYPFHYVPRSSYHNTVQAFLDSTGMNSDKAYGIDYLETLELVLISFYYKNQGLENRLIVLNQSKEIVLDEILGTQLNGITDRSFFVSRGNLIFVKGNSNFLSYQLSQP